MSVIIYAEKGWIAFEVQFDKQEANNIRSPLDFFKILFECRSNAKLQEPCQSYISGRAVETFQMRHFQKGHAQPFHISGMPHAP